MDTTVVVREAPLLLPSPHDHEPVSDNTSNGTHSNTASARNSTHGSDDIFDRYAFRSPINESESEYEDEDDLISEMPESLAPSCYGEETTQDEAHDFAQYTPSRRSPFRNPSSVRGMQLETTPPHLRSPTRESLNKHHKRLSIGSRNSTPRSIRSYRSGSPTKLKPVPKKESLLVLLHVTILPISCPYSQAVLQEVAPPHILQNWKLLREKVPDTVLERGILVPHPREDYELLEERLLESLELAIPRILKCGHYHRDDEESDLEEADKADIPQDPADDSDNDSDICGDCTRRVRDGSKGSNGTGKKRWNIRIYAANGLMRAGAWGAAWKEMERVDVEISPWMDDALRRQLDLRRAQEQEEHHQQQTVDQPLEPHALYADLHSSSAGLDEARRREIYGDLPSRIVTAPRSERNFTLGEIVEAYEHSPSHDHEHEPASHDDSLLGADEASPSPSIRYTPVSRTTPSAQPQQPQDVSVTELLANYIKLLLQDRRNVALMFLSVVVLWLAIRAAPTSIPTQVMDKAVNATGAVQEGISSISVLPQSVSETFASVTEEVSEVVTELASELASGILPTAILEQS